MSRGLVSAGDGVTKPVPTPEAIAASVVYLAQALDKAIKRIEELEKRVKP